MSEKVSKRAKMSPPFITGLLPLVLFKTQESPLPVLPLITISSAFDSLHMCTLPLGAKREKASYPLTLQTRSTAKSHQHLSSCRQDAGRRERRKAHEGGRERLGALCFHLSAHRPELTQRPKNNQQKRLKNKKEVRRKPSKHATSSSGSRGTSRSSVGNDLTNAPRAQTAGKHSAAVNPGLILKEEDDLSDSVGNLNGFPQNSRQLD